MSSLAWLVACACLFWWSFSLGLFRMMKLLTLVEQELLGSYSDGVLSITLMFACAVSLLLELVSLGLVTVVHLRAVL